MFARIANSFALARSSWGVLRTDKKLVLFPVLSGIACLFVLISFVTPFLIRPDAFANLQDQAPWALALIGFAFYFVNYFVIVFFNAALVSCALIRFHGGEPTLGDGLRAASARLPQILAWALVSATVGMLLKAIENANEKVGQIVSAILGTVWTVMTYFVVPVLVVEKVGPIDAVKRSIQILRKTWGEALVGNFGLGFFQLLLFLPALLFIIPAVLCFVVGGPLVWLGIAFAVLAVIYILLAVAVSSALGTVFLTALYQYAAFNQVPGGFEADTMAHAFVPAKAS
jgi:uncharacterized membrane protein YeaQ/YmgE (transglycosylase-associated protein family)